MSCGQYGDSKFAHEPAQGLNETIRTGITTQHTDHFAKCMQAVVRAGTAVVGQSSGYRGAYTGIELKRVDSNLGGDGEAAVNVGMGYC